MTQPLGEYSLDLTQVADPVGLALSIGTQRYQVTGVRLGDNGTLSISWRSRCTVCGEAFEVTTPRSQIREPTRRCPAHRKAGRPPAVVGK